jgi:putative FmdB family regulatory protein
MPIYDYGCANDHVFEVRCHMDERPAELPCEVCGEPAHQQLRTPPKMFNVIVPDYPGSKALKAGYVHSHGPKDATRIQSGYGGSQGPRAANPFVRDWIRPENRPLKARVP